MTEVAACIPSIGKSPHLYDLCRVLLDDGVSVRVYVNQPGSAFDWDRLSGAALMHMHGVSIYQEWNYAARWACHQDSYLLCCNDDIVVAPGTAAALATALDNHPDAGLVSVALGHPVVAPAAVDWVSHALGNRRTFAQWCFMARPEAWQDVDPRYRIWYGDDDLIWKVNAAGWSVGVLQGVGVTHYTSTTSVQEPWVYEAAGQDGLIWQQEH